MGLMPTPFTEANVLLLAGEPETRGMAVELIKAMSDEELGMLEDMVEEASRLIDMEQRMRTHGGLL